MRGSLATLIVCAFLESPVVRAQQDAALTLGIEDAAGVSAHLLREAEAGTVRIFAAAGVGVTPVRWSRQGANAPVDLLIIIVHGSDRLLDSRRLSVEPMGVAPRGDTEHRGRIAYVFYDQVQQTAEGYSARRDFFDRGELLGAVIAHEVGHLLQPSGFGHSRTGVMRGVWDRTQVRRAVFGELEFSGQEAQEMRRAVARAGSRTSPAGATMTGAHECCR